MEYKVESNGNIQCALVSGDDVHITDVQSALDLIASVKYETDCNRIAISKAALAPEFFDLSTKIAGEILQKFVQYYTKLAIIGDFSAYTSKALRDFIIECNRGNHIFFVADEAEAVSYLTRSSAD